MNLLQARGVLNVVVEYPLGEFTFGVPLWRNLMDYEDVTRYESALMDLFSSRLSGMEDCLLFDCGADIGIFSASICSRSRAIASVIAFEPNPEALPYLKKNL